MKIDHDNATIYVHQSDISTWRMCPEQQRYKLRGEYPDYDSDAAAIGTRVHGFIENCLHHFRLNRSWPQPDLANQLILSEKATLDEQWDTLWLHPHQIRGVREACDHVTDICRRWYNEYLPQIPTHQADHWLIEHKFDHEIGEVEVEMYSHYTVRLRGSIDFFDGHRIQDWKTGTLREEWRKERYDVQSTVYTWALGVEDFLFVHLPRGKAGHVTLPIHRNQGHWGMMIEEALAIARHAAQVDINETWTLGPTDWWCSERWCAMHAQGKCMGAVNPIKPDEAVHLTSLIERGVSWQEHS